MYVGITNLGKLFEELTEILLRIRFDIITLIEHHPLQIWHIVLNRVKRPLCFVCHAYYNVARLSLILRYYSNYSSSSLTFQIPPELFVQVVAVLYKVHVDLAH